MTGRDPVLPCAVQSRAGVVVIAATNRPDLVDPALLRPGRFDRLLHVPRPDAAGRAAVLAVLTRRTPLDPDVDLTVRHLFSTVSSRFLPGQASAPGLQRAGHAIWPIIACYIRRTCGLHHDARSCAPGVGNCKIFARHQGSIRRRACEDSRPEVPSSSLCE